MHRLSDRTRFERIRSFLPGGLAIVLLALAGVRTASAQGTITDLSPSSVPAGSPGFNLVVTAINLPVGGVHLVYWNSGALPTTANGNQFTVSVTAAMVALPGPVSITVQTANLSTPAVTFTIAGPAISLLSPASVFPGAPTFTLTINGSGFVPSNGEYPYVTFGSDVLTPTYINSNQLQVSVDSSLVTTPGPIPVIVVDVDPLSSTSPAFNFIVGAPLKLLGQIMPDGTVGALYDFTFQTAGGFPPLTFTATGLPSTLVLNSATGEVKGTPASVGFYHVQLTVTDSAAEVVNAPYTISIAAPVPAILGFSNGLLPAGQVAVPYVAAVTAAGGVPPYSISLVPPPPTAAGGTLPPGLTLRSDGAITGTPTAAGTYKFTLQVADSTSATASLGFSITIAPPTLAITTGALSNAPAGSPLTISFVATGGVPGYTFSIDSGYPAGMAFSAAGTLSGTPTTPGTYKFTVTVKDSASATASKAFTLAITPPPMVILTAGLPSGQAGVPYSVQFYAANGQPPYTWTATGAPPGVTMSATGALSGTPTADGAFTVAVTATDTPLPATAPLPPNQAKQTYTLTIAPAPLVITTASLPAGVAGTAYSATLAANGGDIPYAWVVQGLPSGINASAAGVLSGTPVSAANATVTATVTDSKGATATAHFNLAVAPAPIGITTTSLPNGTVQTAYSVTLAATGGAGSNKWAATGLPAGLTMSAGGTISGTPTAPGVSVVAVTVTDAAGTVAVATFTLTIAPPLLTITTATLPPGVAGAAYSVTLSATGGAGSNTWAATGLPAGLSMSAAGILSGTPTADGAFAAAVTVTDAAGTQAKQTYTLTIAPAPLAVTATPLPPGVMGTAYTATLAATGGAAPYTWAVQGLPPGITASTGGVLSGAPTSAGSFTVSPTVTDSKGATAGARLTLTITAPPIAISTTSLPNATVQSAYSVTLAATGGAGSNKWAATGLPPGLAMSVGGTISGTPTAPGVSVVAVTVTDASSTVAVQTYTLSILLPPTPAVNFSPLPPTANPGTQTGVQVGMGSPYPLPVTATLTLVFTPDSGADDPAVQFSTGGRSVVIQIPAGAATLTGTALLQTGTVAGTIVITARLSAAGQDITPTPAPQITVHIAPAAPAISSVTAFRNPSGFTVTVIGFATPRQVTQANFQFTAASGANLTTGSLSIPATSLFSAWYANPAAAPYGSQFSFVQPFNVTGDTQGIASVTVTLVNAQGTSAGVTANLQ